MTEPAEKLEPSEIDSWTAVEFLKSFDLTGRHNLVAIDPETGFVTGRTFEPSAWADVEKWVENNNGRRNCYFSVNEPGAAAPHSKLRKADICAARAIHVDVDPRRAADPTEERSRLRKLISDAAVKPTLAVDSGGGIQAFWKFEDKISLTDGGVEIENLNRSAAALLGEGDATQNVERVMRLPGTINMPDAGKRAKGRTARRAEVLWQDGPTYTRAHLAASLPPVARRATAANDDSNPRVQECIAEIAASDYQAAIEFGDLPGDLSERFDAFLEAHRLHDWWESRDNPGSEKRFALAGHMKREGAFTAADFARIAWIWPQSTSRPDVDVALSPRALARDWMRCWTAPGEEFGIVEDVGDEETPDAAPAKKPPARSKILGYAQMCAMPEPQWLIEGVMQQRSAALIYGKSNTFKSFLAIDQALSIATGRPWHGMRTHQGNALYLATEGANGVGRLRVPGWYDHYDISEVDRSGGFLYPQEITLDRKEPVDELIRDANAIGPFSLIVLDIFGGTMAGSEIEDTTARTWVHSIQRLIRELGTTVLTVAHTGWHDETRARMHTHFWGSFDTRLRVEGDKERRTSSLTVERHKDADSAGSWGFSLEPSHGTLVPFLDDSVTPEKKSKWRQLHKTALAALHSALAEHGEQKSEPGWPTDPVVLVEQWKALCPNLSSKDTPDARRVAFARARDFLLEVEAIKVREDYVWVPLE